MSVLGAAREFLERALAMCTQGTARAEERVIEERVCELMEQQDF